MSEIFDSIIIGSGPAGYTASIYLGRANIKHLILASSLTPGGNLMNTSDIENYPGVDAISGPDLVNIMENQAKSFGGIIKFENANSIIPSPNETFIIQTDSAQYETRTVLIASGQKYSTLNIPGETDFQGKGISYCAVCDGFFFKNKNVAVVGGGDSALEEAIFLSNICSNVTLIHRRDKFRGSKILQNRVHERPNIKLLLDSVIESFEGADDKLSAINVKNVKTNELEQLSLDGVFVAIGSKPNISFCQNVINLDANNYIKVNNRQETNIKGIYAAGDVADPTFQQAIVAAGSGAKAAISIIEYLED